MARKWLPPRNPVKGTDAPLLQLGQCRPRQFPFRFAVAVSENDVQFVNRRGRQDQCVADSSPTNSQQFYRAVPQ